MDGPAMGGDPVRYTCLRVPERLGSTAALAPEVWGAAPWFASFVDIVSAAPAWFATRTALLWDDAYLRIAFELEEPNLVATMEARDDPLYLENDVEVFVAGPNSYYELELNALNNVYEVLWVWNDALAPGGRLHGRKEFGLAGRKTTRLSGIGDHVHPRGERTGFLDWDLSGLAHSVEVRGTVNDPRDRDTGWRVELALPWAGLASIVDKGHPVARPGDIWRIECSRFEWTTKDGTALSQPAGWTWSAHGYYDSHMPECFPYIELSAGTVDPGA